MPGPSQGGTRDTRPVPVLPPAPRGAFSLSLFGGLWSTSLVPQGKTGVLWETHPKPEGPKARGPLYSFYFLSGVRGGGGPEPGGNVSSVLRVSGHAL